MPRESKEEKNSEKAVTKKTIAEIALEELLSSSAMVNPIKAERAYRAVYGGAKSGTAELLLARKFKSEGYEGKELVERVYEGLGGLIDAKRAAINRENEKKERSKKRNK